MTTVTEPRAPSSPSSSAPHRCAPKTSSPSPATARASSSTPPRWCGSRHPALSSRASPTIPSRTTASRPASARSRPPSSPPSAACSCRRASSARTRRAPGAEVEREVVRALQLLRLQTLATAHTGVRPVVVETYAAMLNAGITPIVREYGSLGCSGDLAPLSHVALAAMGEGRRARRRRRAASTPPRRWPRHPSPRSSCARRRASPSSTAPTACSGCCCSPSTTCRCCSTRPMSPPRCRSRASWATDAVFAADLMALRPQVGQAASAANLRAFLADSPIMASHRDPAVCTRVQDAYSLRCSPQVHGAARDTVDYARTIAFRELSSAVDNPVITDDGRVESNGNFHGAPVAYVLDFLAIAVADVASISERRTDRALDPARSHGLPPFLAHEVGVDSGLMIAQYAAAGIVSELKRLAVPASVDSIPSLGDAGGPRLDGLGGRAQAPARHRRARPGARDRGAHRRARASTCARRSQPGPATGAVRDLVRTVVDGPGARPLPLTRHGGGDRARPLGRRRRRRTRTSSPNRCLARQDAQRESTCASRNTCSARADQGARHDTHSSGPGSSAPRAAPSAPPRAGAPRPPSACS